MKKILTTEAELAACVVLHFKSQGYTVYQEVHCPSGVIDIYATLGRITFAIETKMSLGFSVMEQAVKRMRNAHYVSIATPYRDYTSFELRVCQQLGLGVITTPRYEADKVRIILPAKLNRKIHIPELNDFQKNESVAGTKGGGYWTPFKQTCDNLERHVRGHKDGILFREAVKQIKHHYTNDGSAQSCLSAFCGTVIPNLRVGRKGRDLYVHHIIHDPKKIKLNRREGK